MGSEACVPLDGEWRRTPRVGVGFARLFLDRASLDVWRKWAVYAGFTGSCVRGTGLGINSVPVVDDRALLRADLLRLTAEAAFLIRTASLLTLFIRFGVDLPVVLELRKEPVFVFLLH